MEFNLAYQALEECLTNYIILKKDSGWAKKVATFQQFSMPIILESQDIHFLQEKVRQLSESLCSAINWMSLGFVGGSTLQTDLQKLLAEMAKPPVLQVPSDLVAQSASSSSSVSSTDSDSVSPRPASLPPSPVSVTGYLPFRVDPFVSNVVYRDAEAEQLKQNKNQYLVTFVPPSEEEQHAILGMRI